MADRDLREWLGLVGRLGEFKRIEGADWDLEIGAIADMARKESKTDPCILLDSIKGYPKDFWRLGLQGKGKTGKRFHGIGAIITRVRPLRNLFV